jgi:hypothetical protein
MKKEPSDEFKVGASIVVICVAVFFIYTYFVLEDREHILKENISLFNSGKELLCHSLFNDAKIISKNRGWKYAAEKYTITNVDIVVDLRTCKKYGAK